MFWHVPVPSGKQKTLSGSVPRIRNKKATLCGQMEPQWTTQVSNALSIFRNKIIMLYEVFPVKCFQRYVLGGEKLSIAHPKMKKGKNKNYVFQKYSKFLSVLLEHLIKDIPLYFLWVCCDDHFFLLLQLPLIYFYL